MDMIVSDTATQLKSYVDRLERLLDQLDAVKEDVKELKAEIKSNGFNVKAVDRVVALRRNQSAADKEAEYINDILLYAHVTGTRLDVAAPEEPAETAPRLAGAA